MWKSVYSLRNPSLSFLPPTFQNTFRSPDPLLQKPIEQECQKQNLPSLVGGAGQEIGLSAGGVLQAGESVRAKALTH